MASTTPADTVLSPSRMGLPSAAAAPAPASTGSAAPSAGTEAVIASAAAEAANASSVLAGLAAAGVPPQAAAAGVQLPASHEALLATSASEARNKAEQEYRNWEAQQALRMRDATASPHRSITLGGPAPTTSLPQHPVAVPLNSPIASPVEDVLRQAELGLLETERRVRSEAEQLEATRKSRLQATEAELHRMRQDTLQDLEDRDRKWQEKKAEDMGDVEAMRAQLAEREARLRQAEAEHQEELMRADDDLKRRTLSTEEARRRTTQALETRIRAEVRSELAPQLRIDIEKELTQRITAEVQADLHAEFQTMCDTVRVEVERARLQMQTEIEAALEPKVEARLLPVLMARAEAEVQQAIVQQLQDTATTASRLRDELQLVASERDALATQLAAVSSSKKQELDSAAESLTMERMRAEQLASDVAVAAETLRRFEEERQLYPLLKEVESMPGPWAHVNLQLDQLRKEKSQLQADAQFAAHEIDMLRKQVMENMGNHSMLEVPAVSPIHGKQLPTTPGGYASSAAPLMDSVMSRNTKCGERSHSFSPQTPAPMGRGGTPRKASVARGAEKRDSSIPCKNRFRHTPVKEAKAPTFRMQKDDRERVFFAEMEQLKESSTRDARARKISGKRTTSFRGTPIR